MNFGAQIQNLSPHNHNLTANIYYITNLRGDVMYLVDSSGATVAIYEYDPFGNIVSQSGSMATINPLRYRGYYYDADMDMYYLQSRYYDPNIGRFINPDDIAFLGVSATLLSYNLLHIAKTTPLWDMILSVSSTGGQLDEGQC